jgi:hypothetical protein
MNHTFVSSFSQKTFTLCDKALAAPLHVSAKLRGKRRGVGKDRPIMAHIQHTIYSTQHIIQHFALDLTLGLLQYLLRSGFRVTKAGKSPMYGF